ncbi:MAG TPA: hypothetical protein VGM82_04295 [Gemmatimonadaceae bacterium]|jgi:hypothetical protein
MSFVRRALRFIAPTLLVGSIAGAQNTASTSPPAASTVPAKLTDAAFWKLVTDISEGGGYFQSDNFVSNETTFQWVIPPLLRSTHPGGAYLGVGPDQNFPYIIALKPKIVFIFDIRRQNLLAHLMYKALIEQSNDRVEFMSRLFSRPRPSGVDTTSTSDAILLAYQGVPPDSAMFRKNFGAVLDRLRKTHGFTLSAEDSTGIEYVYRSFVVYGPDITYDSNRRVGYGRGRMPSYAQLQIEADSDRVQRGYLANEANFRVLKQYETDNLIVPVVGNFAGDTAIKRVGAYLKQNQLSVTAFYLSNVEQYLFNQNDDWKKFFNNVATLPLDSTSTFIRSSFNGMGPQSAQYYASMMRSQQLRASITQQLQLFKDGKILSYYDILNTSK